ncbi:hypothetical protein [Guptibacillus hwajinpoensis]|uniref:Uncharacterized protein n=2 Tax=Guptibacillus hwajinpoensis TaxID=208199 RepID=A0ABU0JZI3_9BACL|nr:MULTISPECIES: hypothetical protein [Alkalihalobacillus]KMM38027.1 hypothetical protein AB986_01485 [Alkalihalobacillus macyae]MDQ0481825.1 hypothetical protein [Alkalihalobacillus hemicentroti]
MTEEFLSKVRRGLLFIAFLMLAFSLSYLIAYPLGYSPLGYEVIELKDDLVVLQSYNVLGMENERITYQPQEDEIWKLGLINDLIDQQQSEYLLFFTTLMLAIFLGGMGLLRSKSFKSVVFQGFLYVLIPGISLVRHLNDIKDILQSSP